MSNLSKLRPGHSLLLAIICVGLLSFVVSSFTDLTSILEPPNYDKVEGDRIWHVKAIHPEGYFLDVKAIDSDGNKDDV